VVRRKEGVREMETRGKGLGAAGGAFWMDDDDDDTHQNSNRGVTTVVLYGYGVGAARRGGAGCVSLLILIARERLF